MLAINYKQGNKMKRVKFKDTYSEEIAMFSQIHSVSLSVAEDKLFEKFSYINFDVNAFNEKTLVELLWSKTK